MARDVGYDDREAAVLEGQDVEVVSADRRARSEQGRELDLLGRRQVGGDEALLHVACDRELLLEDLGLGRRRDELLRALALI